MLIASIFFYSHYQSLQTFFSTLHSNQLDKFSNISNRMNPFPFKINITDSFTTTFRNAIANSFDEYYTNCAKFDEYRPKAKTCINNFGFSSTMFESLEVLYLFNLKEQYKKAYNFIMNEFSIQNMHWINVREFWSRCIGSLLSCYLLTSDKKYLLKAIEFSNTILQFPQNAQYVNIFENLHRSHQWEETPSLTTIISGLPELFLLSKLTKCRSYSIEYLTTLNNIPSKINSNKLFNVIDFYHILSLSYPIISMKSLRDILNTTMLKFTENKQQCLLFNSHILDTLSMINQNLENVDKYSELIIQYKTKMNLNSFISMNDCKMINYVLPFTFDSSNFRAVLRDSHKFEQDRELILNMINSSLTLCQSNGKAFSGLINTNSLELVSTDIQHSNFFGQWMNLAGYLLLENTSFWKSAVFNERGHLLYFSSISLNDDDD